MCKCALRELRNASTVGLENDLRISLPGLAAGLPTSWNVFSPPLTLQTVTPWTKEQNDKASFNPNSGKTRDSYVKLKQGIAIRLFNRAWNHYDTIKHIRIIFAFPSVVCSFYFLPQFHTSLWEDSHLASFRWNYLAMVMLHLRGLVFFWIQFYTFHRRNAAVEGYIHQFLYTYRFLCTPEQLLQFITEKFISAARYWPITVSMNTWGKKQSNTANWQRSHRSHFFFFL